MRGKHLEAVQKSVAARPRSRARKGQLTSAKGKYLGAEAQLSYTEIRSPISGVVTDRPLFAGETAAAGNPVITVMDTSALLAKLHLSQSSGAAAYDGGDAATHHGAGLADPVPAKVSLISPALDPGSTTVEVWLRVENPKGTLKAGRRCTPPSLGRRCNRRCWFPSEAVQTGPDGSKFVMVIGAGRHGASKPVTLGITDDGRVQIISGLTAADMVITTGGYGLDEGTKVKVGTARDDETREAGAEGDK